MPWREPVGVEREAVAKAVARVASHFSAGGELTLELHSGGHIHETWFVTSRYDDFVLQRLNGQVFPDCVRVAENVVRVIGHLQKRVRKRALPDPDRRVLTPVRARGGGLLVFDDDGTAWRAFQRVERACSYEVVPSADAAYQVGRALGQFFDDVQDLPCPLPETIPGFKDFTRRRQDFELVVDTDPRQLAGSAGAEIEAVRRHHRLVDELDEARRGRLRKRTVHNDARVNNVLLDADTGEALCVIDLDTVASGTVLFDFGDLLRSATTTVAEDESDGEAPGQAVADELLEAAVAGYLREAGLVLSADELDLLPLAGPLMAYENALRFLTDHLVGDVYFRVERPGQNLDRARRQLRVLEALTEAQDRVAELARRSV